MTKNGDLPALLNLQGHEYQIRDIIGRLIRDDLNGEAVLKMDKVTGVYWDRDARQINKRGYLVDSQGNVIDRRNRVIFRKFELVGEGEVPKIFSFLTFDICQIRGKF